MLLSALLLLAEAALSLSAPAAATPRTWPPAEALQAIGRVNVAGYKGRAHCSGALAAPDRVLTAAHCLRKRGGRAAAPADIHFLPGWDRGRSLAHGRALCVRFLDAASELGDGALGLGSDAAVIHLRAPIALPPLPIAEGPPPRPGAPLAIAGYPRHRPHALALSKGCDRLGRMGPALRLGCKAAPGVSGAPALQRSADGGAAIAGLVVAADAAGQALILPASAWRALLEAPCPAD